MYRSNWGLGSAHLPAIISTCFSLTRHPTPTDKRDPCHEEGTSTPSTTPPRFFHNGELVFTTGGTTPELHVEVWSGSHPFFTGKQQFIDSAGRVEKFQKKFGGNYFAGKKAGCGPRSSRAAN